MREKTVKRKMREWPDALLLAEQRRGWSLMIFCASRNARPPKALARANGTSRRASGWAGEKVARSGRSISPHP
jgi:hypothetical protein